MNLHIIPGTHQPNPVNQLETREVNSLSNILSRALHNEPHLEYLIPDEETRHTVSPWFFQIAINVSRLFGEIYTTDSAEGAALWIRLEHRWSIRQVVQTGTLGIPFDLEGRILRRCLKLGA